MKRLASAVALAMIVGLTAAGCSKSSDQSTSTSATAPADAGSSPAASTETAAATTATAAADAMGAAAGTGDAAHGKELFTQNCSSCHGATGTEGGVGPSLKGEKGKKNDAQTIAWIKNPTAPMPKLYPSPLSEKDVADVAAYVQTL